MADEMNVQFTLNERKALLLAMTKTLNEIELDTKSSQVSGMKPGDIVDLFLDANMKNIQNTLRKNYKDALSDEIYSSGTINIAQQNGITKESLFD
ncbi:hypothetical protein RD055328_05620 [Companilactobacillus sp. RD055328]|uniref:hypothetical protein n=1 Tax=Companilactobacillus sp. RD055328 TaxID=2916634 RepID=UPI001FC7EFA6|nr:hypothetical protein [Companilactobacillus sp. RD055328]GKQ42639.1 hypothetical protein RD055328_05620 [Companilactobacillus sp. RD055328]